MIMATVTLQDIKARRLVEIAWRGYMRSNLNDWNIRIYRERMETPDGIRRNISDIVQDGNDPMDNEEMLDRARWYIEMNVYTDEQWENYLIPAINRMIAYNNTFVRWLPGYVVRSKQDGRMYAVEYDYATGFGWSCGRKCRDYTSLSLAHLNDEGRVDGCWCWAKYEDFELVDTGHCDENIARIREYHVAKDDQVPYYLDSRIISMYYQNNRN